MTENSDTPTQRIDYAARRRERADMRAAQRRSRIPLLGIAIVVGIVALLAGVEAATSAGRVHPGVVIAGVKVGGMKPAAARSALNTSLPGKASRPVVVTFADENWKLEAQEIGLDFDYDAMVDDAMAVGRDKNPLAAAAQRLDAWFGGRAVPARPKADQQKLTKVFDKFAIDTDVAPVDAKVTISGDKASVVPAKAGSGLDRSAAERLILTAMLSEKRTIDAPIVTVPVNISDEDAKAAADVADRMLDGPASVTYGTKSWQFGTNDIAKWIAFRNSDAPEQSLEDSQTIASSDSSVDATLVAYISQSGLSKTVVPKVGAKVGHPAKNARFKTANGVVTIIPSEEGVGPDLEALSRELTVALTTESNRTVEMKTAKAEPDITTEEAKAMGVTERISRFTTTYESGNRPRVNNIHLLGDALDGTLIAPGATFSFNGTVGERTAEKGYQEAGAIVQGKLVQQLGGGICQVGTTLFNAIFESGFPVVQRQNHSFYISHYPKGRDATVSWGGPDLKFKNDSDDWLLISVSYSASSVTIALYGTDPGYEVESKTSDWSNERPYSTETIKDPTMKVGSKIVEDRGITGRTCTVTRTVYKGGQVVRVDKFKSVYKPKIEVVRVGTKKVSGSKVATGTPTR